MTKLKSSRFLVVAHTCSLQNFLYNLISGEWRLVDKYLGLALVNRFNATEVLKCLVHWDFGTVNLELWSDSRPVSEQSPMQISHQYEVVRIR
jgi:alpha-glucosidase